MSDLIGRIPLPTERRVPRRLGPEYWVPRWAWLRWTLKKLRLLKPTEFVEIKDSLTTITIRAADIIEFLHKIQCGLYDTYGWQITDLYVGREHFAQLLRIRDKELMEARWGAAMSIEVPDVWGEQRGEFQTVRYHGVVVHFVPWFKGVLALPSHLRPGCVDHKLERSRC